MRIDSRIVLGVLICAAALSPPSSHWLEARLVTHVLGQYALLVVGGALIGAALGRRHRAGWTAAPAFLSGMVAIGFWLLPRWIDAALSDPVAECAKAASLIALAGIPLGWGWAQAGPVLRGFVLANAASMLLIMGWIQQVIPQRLCNAYLISDQRALGIGFLVLAAGLVVGSALRVLTPHHQAP